MTLVVDARPMPASTPDRSTGPVLHTTDPDRYARACRARAIVLDLEGHHEEAQHLRALATATQENRP
ncbi:hypothetical protein Xcel_3452 (plasmid) [Xylanimonas cellulosilytica DSM 15894]|uniref:Uncharacterized protein n=1 Tax=Xylanimonas cellulosilytica (strain DSM 15894 / JCM 12276 / CECT 5975 / KCTC 9989 / LMG 20990 / NBRC 107835 / XIL07) TaxID=446471 RepID=D1C0Y5_XYLCX|nr:hypothetical protein [Xylanimonas cellulosilytica]ACZ32451.1 hypothetical protein Xcel_3452 [Xylanimonas cellulosilytica DSM 15894]